MNSRAALWSGEDEPDQSAQHKPQRSSAIGKSLSSSETKARTLQEESEDEAARFLSELANEYELAQKTETDIDSDGSGDADEEAFADESSEEVSERDDSSTQYHDEPASEIKVKKPVPRNPFAQHQDTEEEFVAEQDVALQRDRGSFGSSSPARAMGGAASVGEAIVLMREDEGLTETEEAEQENEAGSPSDRPCQE